MDTTKRYQVFLSSTFTDLREERLAVGQALMKMKCIPAGMEWFNAIDQEQFEYIKRVIDLCDYYVLIIGGRYGSVTSDGVSYTEKEYDYAVKKGIKVIAALHKHPDQIPQGKSEVERKAREKLEKFRKKVSTRRLVSFWENKDELKANITLSMVEAMNDFPAVGWVRADQVAGVEALSELNEVRKQNQDLQRRISALENTPEIPNLAGFEDEVTMNVTFKDPDANPLSERELAANITATWGNLFAFVGPILLDTPAEIRVRIHLAHGLFRAANKRGLHPKVDETDFQKLKVQFIALGLIKLKSAKDGPIWQCTPAGERAVVQRTAIRTSSSPSSADVDEPALAPAASGVGSRSRSAKTS